MLFHSLAGSEMHGVIDQMDRRSKADAPAITSAIDRGETETVGWCGGSEVRAGKDIQGEAGLVSRLLGTPLRSASSPRAASDETRDLGREEEPWRGRGTG